jgi:hypothetical protein
MLATIHQQMQGEFGRSPPKWTIQSSISQTDMDFLHNECNADSEFDTLQVRKKLYHRLKKGTAHFEVRVCEYGQVIAIYEEAEQKHAVPWDLWARILRLYHREADKPFKVYFLASTHLRVFPRRPPIRTSDINAEPLVRPIHINGGYTYPCNHETIVLYRAEDATRVLLHELMHSTCMDNPKLGIDQVEAETEAWAELYHAAFLSQGNKERFHQLVLQQSAWMQSQNARVQQFMKKPKEFPWRYTIGKEDVWRRWGILQPPYAIPAAHESLRLTPPPDPLYQRAFGVPLHSTIL